MAGGWIKSLQCKSRAVDDVLNPNPRILRSASCGGSLKGVLLPLKKGEKQKPSQFEDQYSPSSSSSPSPSSSSHQIDYYPYRALTELPEAHPSRKVIEIIFKTRWGFDCKPFSGSIELVFKVHNGSRAVSAFENYRRAVKARADVGDARCAADGNEAMRFMCVGARGTYAASWRAHDSAGRGSGRRAMLVCRVIAGRVSERVDKFGCDSVCGEDGELVVYDQRAVLPCFLIVYKL